MSNPAIKKDATYEDLRAVPENLVAEILGSELYATPRPSLPHAHAASVLCGELMGPFHHGRNGPGGWLILVEPELHLGSDIVVPDLAGWRRDRLLQLPAAAHIELAPDWACEIVSPSTERLDRAKKLWIYARESVAHAWLVNPTLQTLEVLRLDDKRWTLVETFEGKESVRPEPFAAVPLELGALWI